MAFHKSPSDHHQAADGWIVQVSALHQNASPHDPVPLGNSPIQNSPQDSKPSISHLPKKRNDRRMTGCRAWATVLNLWGIGGGVALLGMPSALAQSIAPAPDGTGTTITINGNQIDISGGSRSSDGANLFHSFQQFNLNSTEIANFLATPDLRNILGRVVGGDPSRIDGLIQVTGGSPNLFLLNPAGLIFGPNARLDVPGSFTATSATGLGFGNRWLNGLGSNDYASLVGDPTGFAFAVAQPGAIFNAGTLSVPLGQNLSLVGGTVLSVGTLSAPGGQLTVTAVPGESFVRLTPAGSVLAIDLPTAGRSGVAPGAVGPILPRSLPELLAGQPVTANGLTINPDGTVAISANTTPTQAGDISVRSAQAGTATISASNNLFLWASQISTTGDLNLLANNSIIGSDTVTNPLQIMVGGRSLLWGTQNVSLFGLNHPNSQIGSVGNIRVISQGEITNNIPLQSMGQIWFGKPTTETTQAQASDSATLSTQDNPIPIGFHHRAPRVQRSSLPSPSPSPSPSPTPSPASLIISPRLRPIGPITPVTEIIPISSGNSSATVVIVPDGGGSTGGSSASATSPSTVALAGSGNTVDGLAGSSAASNSSVTSVGQGNSIPPTPSITSTLGDFPRTVDSVMTADLGISATPSVPVINPIFSSPITVPASITPPSLPPAPSIPTSPVMPVGATSTIPSTPTNPDPGSTGSPGSPAQGSSPVMTGINSVDLQGVNSASDRFASNVLSRRSSVLNLVAMRTEAERSLICPEDTEQKNQLLRRLDCDRKILERNRRSQNYQQTQIALIRLGSAYYEAGQYPQATEIYQESQALAAQQSDVVSQVLAARELGNIEAATGTPQQAIAYYEQALRLSDGIDDARLKVAVLNSLALTLINQKDYQQGEQQQRAALALAREHQDVAGEALALTQLGLLHYQRAQYPQAIAAHQDSLKLAKQVHNSAVALRALDNLGLAFYAQKDFANAAIAHAESLKLAQELGDVHQVVPVK